jgi:hypothetical protein
MAETPQENPNTGKETLEPLGYQDRARNILASGKPREQVRRELAQLRDAELYRLMHEASVLEASPFWREVVLRRFIRQRGAGEKLRESADSVGEQSHGR